MKKKRNQAGITLLELTICIIFIAIISAVAMPRFFNMLEDAQAETLRSVSADIEMYLSQGFSRGRTYTELTTDGGGGFWDEIINDAQTSYAGTLVILPTGNGTASITLTDSGRTGTINVRTDAKIEFTALTGFTQYAIDGIGDIVKL